MNDTQILQEWEDGAKLASQDKEYMEFAKECNTTEKSTIDSTNRYITSNTTRQYKKPKCCCQNRNSADSTEIFFYIYLCVFVVVAIVSMNFGEK